MRALRIQPAASDDLDHFAGYIANESTEAALRFLDAAEATFALLADMPFIGGSGQYRGPVPGTDLRASTGDRPQGASTGDRPQCSWGREWQEAV